MGDRTFKNDPANRYGEGHLELKKAVRSIWLGRKDSNPLQGKIRYSIKMC